MEALNCTNFFRDSGWHCDVVSAQGTMAAYISSPIVLRCGKPLDFYLIPKGDCLEFTDDGMTLFGLRALGYPLEDKRNWKGLEKIASRLDFILSDQGAFVAIFPKKDLVLWSAKILRLFASIANWEQERLEEGDSNLSLTDEVAMLLQAKDPAKSLIRDVPINVGKVQVHFDFKWGDTYVDAIRPIQQTVNARLRKVLLVNRAEEKLDLLFIIDDRNQKIKADEEVSVLGEIAKTTRLTDFEAHFKNSPLMH